MQQFIEYLKGKDEVALPEMQFDLGLSYRQLRNIHSALAKRGYVSPLPQGVSVKVNSLYLFRCELSDEDIRKCFDDFYSHELSVLQRLEDLFADEENESVEFTGYENLEEWRGIKSILSHNLVHLFEGKYYPSITRKSYDRMMELINAEDNDGDGIDVQIGYSLFMYWLKHPDEAEEIMKLPFISEDSRDYLNAKIGFYNLTGAIPKFQPQPIYNRNIVKFEIIESFVDQCNFETKEEYDSEARRVLEQIKDADVFPNYIITAMTFATDEIINDLSLNNIKEIKKIINGDGSPDED